MREPHRAAEDASYAVNGYDAMTCAAQEIPILGAMRPAHPSRERVEQRHVNVVDVLRGQFKGFHAYRSSHFNSSILPRDTGLWAHRAFSLLPQ
ncbi:hypothetical protein ACVWYH_007941 [Bradyrhizobium sp. GM24.11]